VAVIYYAMLTGFMSVHSVKVTSTPPCARYCDWDEVSAIGLATIVDVESNLGLANEGSYHHTQGFVLSLACQRLS
jgi:hypothetical protein